MKDKQKVSDILTEYKKLLDNGVITESEYEAKKAELLNELDSGVKEEKMMPKSGASNVFVIGICVAALLICAAAVYSTINFLVTNSKAKDTLQKDEVTFGSYPTERVRESKALEDALMKTVTGLPSDSENANGWTSFRFYDYINVINEETHKTEQKVVESDYAWYKDFKYKDTMYRATFWKKYRSNSAFTPTDSIISYSDNNIYYSENVYYFKYKPVVWRKLEKKENGYTYLVSSKIIDYEDYEPRTLDLFDLEGPKPNNYGASKIRRWLNEDFFKTAFSESNVAKMEKMEVDNSINSTLDVTNQWCCENTNDYVTLLSSKEFSKAEYNLLDKDRRNLKVTDYATSLTYSKGATCYWLRTPANENVDGNGMGLRSLVANYGDKAIGDDPTYYCYYGVVPAISVKL